MKDIKLKFTDKLDENQLAQEINSIEEIDNNNPEPVIEPITPEYREELISNMIESNQAMGLYDNDPIIEEIKEEEPIEEITPTPEPVIERPKNTVRIMDGNFTF